MAVTGQHANQASGRAVCSTAGGGSTSQHSNQTMLPATCKPGFRPGCLFHCKGGGAAPASIQTRQCFRLECLCQLTGGKSSAIHHNGSPPASQNVQHSFFLDLKGLGLAHRPGCVPGAASSRAVLTNCLLRGGGGGGITSQHTNQASFRLDCLCQLTGGSSGVMGAHRPGCRPGDGLWEGIHTWRVTGTMASGQGGDQLTPPGLKPPGNTAGDSIQWAAVGSE